MTVEQFSGVHLVKTPISHNSDNDYGMEQRLRTLEMAVIDNENQYQEEIPIISGNSLRGQLRDLLAEDFLNRLDLELHDSLSNCFYSGGSLTSDGGHSRIKRRRINNIRENIPMLSLLGTAIGSQMVDSRLNVGMLIPIAQETENYTGVESNRSVFEFVDEVFYTRIDDREGGAMKGEETQQMKYKTQVLTPGTKLYHKFTLEGANDIEKSTFGHAIKLFKQNPILGGKKSIGHGEIEVNYNEDIPDNSQYLEFIEDNKEEIKEFILELDGDLQ